MRVKKVIRSLRLNASPSGLSLSLIRLCDEKRRRLAQIWRFWSKLIGFIVLLFRLQGATSRLYFSVRLDGFHGFTIRVSVRSWGRWGSGTGSSWWSWDILGFEVFSEWFLTDRFLRVYFRGFGRMPLCWMNWNLVAISWFLISFC